MIYDLFLIVFKKKIQKPIIKDKIIPFLLFINEE